MNAYARELLSSGREMDVREALVRSFERLEEDLCREALEDKSAAKRLLWVGMTGESSYSK